MRARVIGLAVGAVIGAAGRVTVTAFHLAPDRQGIALVLLAAGVAGLLIGALAGLVGSPLAGAVVGVAVSAVLYFYTLPVVMLFHLLGTLTAPSLLEVAVVGALAGGIGGLARQRAGRRTLRQPSSTRP